MKAPLAEIAVETTAAVGPAKGRTCWPLANVGARTLLAGLAEASGELSADSARAVAEGQRVDRVGLDELAQMPGSRQVPDLGRVVRAAGRQLRAVVADSDVEDEVRVPGRAAPFEHLVLLDLGREAERLDLLARRR